MSLNPASPKIRLLLVDDHFFVRMGLAASLNGEPDMAVVAEAGGGRAAIELFRQHQPDVAILDRRLPDLDGVETIGVIRRDFPQARFVMLSVDDGEDDIYSAIQAGALAYLTKDVQRDELLLAVRTVHGGERYLPQEIAGRLASRVGRPELSSREMEVLRWIARGLSNKEIGDRLTIAEPTVKLHVRNLLAKLGVSDRTQATTEALRRGIIHL